MSSDAHPTPETTVPHGSVLVTTRTGLEVLLRQARPTDEAALRAGFEHLSSDSRYMRFFTAVPRLSGSLLHQLTDLDGRYKIAIAAFDPSQPSEVVPDDIAPDGYGIAVARVIQPDPDVPVAELAIAIIDDYHGAGLGNILMTALIVVAHSRGIERMQAFVLSTNTAMIRLLHRYGAYEIHLDPQDAGVRSLEFSIIDRDGTSALEHGGADPALVERLSVLT